MITMYINKSAGQLRSRLDIKNKMTSQLNSSNIIGNGISKSYQQNAC